MRRRDREWDVGNEESTALIHLLDKRVVTIGGGTGPFGVLSSLKHYPCQITAIVTMVDSGGSSRRLSDEFGQLPFGDLRQALVALSRKGALWRDVFNHRFRKTRRRKPGDSGPFTEEHGDSGSVTGHSLGNLILSALQDINEDNLLWAIEDVQDLLETAGQVLPVTLAHATLCAELADGAVLRGETVIDTRGERHLAALAAARPAAEKASEKAEEHTPPAIPALPAIARVYLEPAAPACAEALRAIRRADVLVLGPGDLYTSILPNLLVEGVAEAIRASEAQTVYVCNLMTKHGETDGFRASDFVRTVHTYLGDRVDRVILHDGSFPPHLLGLYAAQAQHPVEADGAAVRQLVPEVSVAPLLAIHQETLVRHDADRLVRAIFDPSEVLL
ncbi:MAG TPA: gluconeogenesis factor YvcK family protein [Ktedonobacterales bacterium]